METAMGTRREAPGFHPRLARRSRAAGTTSGSPTGGGAGEAGAGGAAGRHAGGAAVTLASPEVRFGLEAVLGLDRFSGTVNEQFGLATVSSKFGEINMLFFSAC